MRNLLIILAVLCSSTIFCQETLTEPFTQHLNIKYGDPIPELIYVWRLVAIDPHNTDGPDSTFQFLSGYDSNGQFNMAAQKAALYKIIDGNELMTIYFDRPGVYLFQGYMKSDTNPIDNFTALVITDEWVSAYKEKTVRIFKGYNVYFTGI